jgi:small GTP-binding protein
MSEFKVVVLGDSGVGKTSLIGKLCSDTFTPDLAPTVGAAFARCTFPLDGASVTLNIWDTAGQEKFQSLVPFYMRNSHGIVFVVDATNLQTLDGLDSLLSQIEDQIKPDTHLVLCANKMDLVQNGGDLARFEVWCRDHQMPLMKASAKTGDGVARLFTHAAEQIYANCGRRQQRAETMVKAICDVEVPTQEKRCCS